VIRALALHAGQSRWYGFKGLGCVKRMVGVHVCFGGAQQMAASFFTE